MDQLRCEGSAKTSTQKASLVLSTLLLAGVSLSLCAVGCFADNRAERIRRKVELVNETGQHWVMEGKNPFQAQMLIKQASQAFDSGDTDKGEGLVDQAMQTLGLVPNGKSSASNTHISSVASNKPVSNLYGNPERVDIVGYNQDAMEPCISLDGRYLFFNGSNDDDIPVHISYAKRISDNRFQYLGLVPGAQSAHRDMAPSLDLNNNLFFTTARSFGINGKSIYVCHWEPTGTTQPMSIDGDISDGCGINPVDKSFRINMDCGISPDGNTLIIAQALFQHGSAGPQEANLFLACRDGSGRFNICPQSAFFLQSVNSPALEYAAAITADGLELYFTRCTVGFSPHFETMVATRSSTGEPFGPPARLAVIEGFSEAPSLTLDKHEMFYHKKDGNLFHIYRVTRSE